MLQDLFNWMSTNISEIGQKLLQLLPLSPFRSFINDFNPPTEWLGWLNWFFPVSELLSIVAIWLSAIAIFYLYSIIMRWVKMIGD